MHQHCVWRAVVGAPALPVMRAWYLLDCGRGGAASRAALWVSACPGLRLAAANVKSVACPRAWVSVRSVCHRSVCSRGSTAVSRHVVMYCPLVLLARLESTSSECRTLHTQSVPVRSAHRTAVHGVWVPGAALSFPSVAHVAVCRI